VDKLPEQQQALARRLGLGMALFMRILLLLSLSWVIGLTAALFTVLGQEISGRDLILILGGLFLLGKSTYEIHENLEGEEGHSSARVKATFVPPAAKSRSLVEPKCQPCAVRVVGRDVRARR
jgi:predicted tellurium resistance membrane protein TerC